MIYKSQNLIVKLLTLTAIIPSLYLTGISLILLIPTLLENIKYNSIFETIALLISIICGITGPIGFLIQLVTNIFSKIKLKIFLLLLSLFGYFTFISVLTGFSGWKNIFDSIKNINENSMDFYMVLWPIIVAIILLIINLYLKTNSNINSLNR